jgi:hypothetical protein
VLVYGDPDNYCSDSIWVNPFCFLAYTFIPPIDSTSTEVNTIDSVGKFNFSKYDVKIIGATFCIVIINKQFIHLNSSITLGNHQCNGAALIFIRSRVIIAYECTLLVMIIWFIIIIIIIIIYVLLTEVFCKRNYDWRPNIHSHYVLRGTHISNYLSRWTRKHTVQWREHSISNSVWRIVFPHVQCILL